MKGDIFNSFFSHYSQSQLREFLKENYGMVGFLHSWVVQSHTICSALGSKYKIWSLALKVQGGGSSNNALNRASRSIGSESKDDIQQKVPNFLYCFNHTRVAVYGALGTDILKEFQDMAAFFTEIVRWGSKRYSGYRRWRQRRRLARDLGQWMHWARGEDQPLHTHDQFFASFCEDDFSTIY